MQNIKVVYGKKGEKYQISYSFSDGLFGNYLIASTDIGICNISFALDEDKSLNELKTRFPQCDLVEKQLSSHETIEKIFHGENNTKPLTLHLVGTDFQIAVWKELLNIPEGTHSTYGEIAQKIGRPRAVRAVGTAIGANPIFYIIPCHKVFRSDGGIGGYRWGVEKKRMINEYERAKGEL